MSVNDITISGQFNPSARQFIYNIPESVLFDHSLVLTDIRIYMIVRSFMDTTGQAFFSNDWAAKKLNVEPRTVRRSIARLIERGHLQREDDNNHRYLTINLKARISSELVTEGRTSVSGGGGHKCPGGEDTNVLQLDQRSITSKLYKQQQENDSNQAAAEKKSWIDQTSELLEAYEQVKQLVPISWRQLQAMASKHGFNAEYVLQKLAILKTRDNVENKLRWFLSALRDDYIEENTAQKEIKPAIEAQMPPEATIAMYQGTKTYTQALAALKAKGISEPINPWVAGVSGISDKKDEYVSELTRFQTILAREILRLEGKLS